MNASSDIGISHPSDSALDYKDFKFYWVARFILVLALQILSVSLAWQIYEKTNNPFQLGLVGLFQFLPGPFFVLFSGSLADHLNRKLIIGSCLAVEAFCGVAFLYFLNFGSNPLWQVYMVLLLFGIARAFMGPAVQALIANIVPSVALPNAIALNSSSFQLATITGPIIGGLLYSVSAILPYIVSILCFSISAFFVMLIQNITSPISKNRGVPFNLFAGVKYILSQPIIFGAMSLDLFAVLLAGTTALLPVFTKDIFDVGAWGLGVLRASPGIGALLMSVWLVHNPLRNHIGLLMYLSVLIYGICIILFGLSNLLWLSVILLIIMGGADMVSVFIRQTLIQLRTPDEVRGRVSAVNMAFIGTSNELGEFRAGTVAGLFGTQFAVIFGGLCSLIIVGLWTRIFPVLLKVNSLDALDRNGFARN